jgi:hypothetical protein
MYSSPFGRRNRVQGTVEKSFHLVFRERIALFANHKDRQRGGNRKALEAPHLLVPLRKDPPRMRGAVVNVVGEPRRGR